MRLILLVFILLSSCQAYSQFYLLQEELGYQTGYAEFDYQIPMGAELFDTQEELDKAIKKADKKVIEAYEAFEKEFLNVIDDDIDVLEPLINQLYLKGTFAEVKKRTIRQHKKALDILKINYSQAKREDDYIKLIFEKLIQLGFRE